MTKVTQKSITPFHEMVPNFSHFMATLKFGMYQGLK
jgi:hypothetical protein